MPKSLESQIAQLEKKKQLLQSKLEKSRASLKIKEAESGTQTILTILSKNGFEVPAEGASVKSTMSGEDFMTISKFPNTYYAIGNYFLTFNNHHIHLYDHNYYRVYWNTAETSIKALMKEYNIPFAFKTAFEVCHAEIEKQQNKIIEIQKMEQDFNNKEFV